VDTFKYSLDVPCVCSNSKVEEALSVFCICRLHCESWQYARPVIFWTSPLLFCYILNIKQVSNWKIIISSIIFEGLKYISGTSKTTLQITIFWHVTPRYPVDYSLNNHCCENFKFHSIQIIQQTRCNSFTSLLLDIYVWLNMFQASPRPSSGAYNCTRSLWFYCWREAAGALLVVIW
jgi:fucose 4-O-acetylase-like acetyltransferase